LALLTCGRPARRLRLNNCDEYRSHSAAATTGAKKGDRVSAMQRAFGWGANKCRIGANKCRMGANKCRIGGKVLLVIFLGW
jgi:hypothetical protein